MSVDGDEEVYCGAEQGRTSLHCPQQLLHLLHDDLQVTLLE